MIETINRIAGVWFDWQGPMLWQSAVLIGLVAVIDRLIRKRAWPQLRYMLWLLVFVKLILPPSLTSPLSLTSHVPALARKAVEVEVQTAGSAPATAAMEAPSNTKPLSTTPPQIASVPAQPTQIESEPLSWVAYAMAVWLAGVVTLATGLSIRLRRLSKDHSAARPQDVPAWFDDLLAETADEMGLKRTPRVAFSERVCCPAVFGVFRPVLLFPTDRLPITRQETRHILLHELAHIKRGDLLVHAGYMVLVTVYWFNPLLWLIRRHVQNLRELCCDATVAAYLREETAAYRETLLAAGRALLARPIDPGLGLLGLFENSHWLPTRLDWLQRRTWRYPWLRRALVAAAAILMLCCILPMAAIKATDAKTAFTATFPGGGMIELIAIRKTGTDQWWRPDGTPLAEAPYDSSEGTDRSDAYEIALRYESLPQGSSGGMDVEGGNWGGTIPMWYADLQKAGKPIEGVTYVIASAQEMETTTVKVHLATGDWTTDSTHPRSSNGWNARAHGGQVIGSVICSVPYEREGKTYATVTYSALERNKCNVRLIALDVNNVEHSSDYPGGLWTSAGFAQITPDFNLPLEDVAAVNLQTRPYTWIEFKNVSLRPGKSQKVEIVVTEPSKPAVPAAEEPGDPPEGFGGWRDYSSQILQIFHTTCVNYLNEHRGSDLPKRPWLLKYRFPRKMFFDGQYQDSCVAPLSYVTSTGYFRSGGFPALQREDFESSEAKRTPILYCKSLLEREAGKGTNVLFGDGHVEYVTAEQLDRLKATSKR